MLTKEFIIFCLMFWSMVEMKNLELKEDKLGCKCGIPRIVETSEDGNSNKETATIYPWVISLQIVNSKERCSGAIIASRYVITAAHCVSNGRAHYNKTVVVYDPTTVKITVGDDKYPKVLKKEEVSVSRIEVPENWFSIRGNSLKGDGDIALVELSEPLDLNIYTPACISQTSDKDRFDAEVSGFKNGTATSSAEAFVVRFNEPERTRREIQTKDIELRQFSVCLNKYEAYKNFTSSGPYLPICGESVGHTNILYGGDSGGPLMVKENDQYILIGEFSLGDGKLWATAQILSTQVIERISSHREWIDDHMTYPEFCPSGPNAGVTRKEYKEYLVEKRAKYVWIGISVGLAVVFAVIVVLCRRKSKSKGSSCKNLDMDEINSTEAISKL